MKRVLFCCAAIMVACSQPARAQQVTPQIQALNQRIGNEINANLQCNATAIALQTQLTAEQAETKRLKDKYEPAAAAQPEAPKP